MFKLSALAAFCCGMTIAASAHATPNRIVTGSERGTYIQIGDDLAHHIAKPAGISLQALPSRGSAENVRRLRNEPGVRLALVQSDVIEAFLDEAAGGNADALQLVKPLRAVMPLYDEEIYFVARADAPIDSVADIRDLRINVGPVGSGTALTATTLYRKLFGTAIDERNVTHLSNDDALSRLVGDRSVDVVVVVAGQPTPLFADMKPEARQYIKLLRFDAQSAGAAAVVETYAPAVIRASSYPTWLAADVPALTTKALLVTYDYKNADIQQTLKTFARSLCQRFDALQSQGHPKWRDVRLELPPLGKSWSYYEPTQSELTACQVQRLRNGAGGMRSGDALNACTKERQVLGLCGTSSAPSLPSARPLNAPAR
jgi:uncharacterized protein